MDREEENTMTEPKPDAMEQRLDEFPTTSHLSHLGSENRIFIKRDVLAFARSELTRARVAAPSGWRDVKVEQVARAVSDNMHKIWSAYNGEYSLSYEQVLAILRSHLEVPAPPEGQSKEQP